jgi:hypothetical protein
LTKNITTQYNNGNSLSIKNYEFQYFISNKKLNLNMKAYDVMSVDIVAAKENVNCIKRNFFVLLMESMNQVVMFMLWRIMVSCYIPLHFI